MTESHPQARRFAATPRGSTARRVIGIALATVLTAAATPAVSLATEASPAPPSSAPAIHGWVGARGGPAGLYSWIVGPLAWMHRVPADYPSSGTVEITFGTISDATVTDMPMLDLERWSLDPASPDPGSPEGVLDVRLRAWLVEVDGTKVVITIKSFPDTASGLVAEAEAIVRSFQLDPSGVGPGRRLVFQLPDGWDSG